MNEYEEFKDSVIKLKNKIDEQNEKIKDSVNLSEIMTNIAIFSDTMVRYVKFLDSIEEIDIDDIILEKYKEITSDQK